MLSVRTHVSNLGMICVGSFTPLFLHMSANNWELTVLLAVFCYKFLANASHLGEAQTVLNELVKPHGRLAIPSSRRGLQE